MEAAGSPQFSRVLPESPLIVALDFPSAEPAMELLLRLKDVPVGMFKVGLELFTAAGPALMGRIAAENRRVFLDLKFHDIPNTVAGAARAAARPGVALLNVHAAGGVAMMRAARGAVREVTSETRVIAVTLLTSLAQEDLARAGVAHTPEEQVLRFAEMAAEAGLDGVVASAVEAAPLRRRFPRPFLIVTPGIRPAGNQGAAGAAAARSVTVVTGGLWGAAGDDQKRVTTPAEAMAAGADYIVVGRPITAAPDPAEAAAEIVEELRSFSSSF